MEPADTIEWNDAMLTGVDEMDQQHRVLVDMLADVMARLAENPEDPLFDAVSRDLLAYAIYHFDTEETLMQQFRYQTAMPDEAQGHLAAHRGFAEEVVRMREAARTDRPAANAALVRFLRDWLIDHILQTDRRLGEFVCRQRRAAIG